MSFNNKIKSKIKTTFYKIISIYILSLLILNTGNIIYAQEQETENLYITLSSNVDVDNNYSAEHNFIVYPGNANITHPAYSIGGNFYDRIKTAIRELKTQYNTPVYTTTFNRYFELINKRAYLINTIPENFNNDSLRAVEAIIQKYFFLFQKSYDPLDNQNLLLRGSIVRALYDSHYQTPDLMEDNTSYATYLEKSSYDFNILKQGINKPTFKMLKNFTLENNIYTAQYKVEIPSISNNAFWSIHSNNPGLNIDNNTGTKSSTITITSTEKPDNNTQIFMVYNSLFSTNNINFFKIENSNRYLISYNYNQKNKNKIYKTIYFANEDSSNIYDFKYTLGNINTNNGIYLKIYDGNGNNMKLQKLNSGIQRNPFGKNTIKINGDFKLVNFPAGKYTIHLFDENKNLNKKQIINIVNNITYNIFKDNLTGTLGTNSIENHFIEDTLEIDNEINLQSNNDNTDEITEMNKNKYIENLNKLLKLLETADTDLAAIDVEDNNELSNKKDKIHSALSNFKNKITNDIDKINSLNEDELKNKIPAYTNEIEKLVHEIKNLKNKTQSNPTIVNDNQEEKKADKNTDSANNRDENSSETDTNTTNTDTQNPPMTNTTDSKIPDSNTSNTNISDTSTSLPTNNDLANKKDEILKNLILENIKQISDTSPTELINFIKSLINTINDEKLKDFLNNELLKQLNQPSIKKHNTEEISSHLNKLNNYYDKTISDINTLNNLSFNDKNYFLEKAKKLLDQYKNEITDNNSKLLENIVLKAKLDFNDLTNKAEKYNNFLQNRQTDTTLTNLNEELTKIINDKNELESLLRKLKDQIIHEKDTGENRLLKNEIENLIKNLNDKENLIKVKKYESLNKDNDNLNKLKKDIANIGKNICEEIIDLIIHDPNLSNEYKNTLLNKLKDIITIFYKNINDSNSANNAYISLITLETQLENILDNIDNINKKILEPINTAVLTKEKLNIENLYKPIINTQYLNFDKNKPDKYTNSKNKIQSMLNELKENAKKELDNKFVTHNQISTIKNKIQELKNKTTNTNNPNDISEKISELKKNITAKDLVPDTSAKFGPSIETDYIKQLNKNQLNNTTHIKLLNIINNIDLETVIIIVSISGILISYYYQKINKTLQ